MLVMSQACPNPAGGHWYTPRAFVVQGKPEQHTGMFRLLMVLGKQGELVAKQLHILGPMIGGTW